MKLKWFGRSIRQSSALAAQLAAYPAYKAPHTGNHLSLSNGQALENLVYLNSVKAERVDKLHALLLPHGIDLKPALRNGRHKPMIESLYRWAQTEWAPVVRSDLLSRRVWLTTNREAEEIIYSVVMDCAIALGEIVIHQRPAYQWGVDLDPENYDDQMPSACRIVLQAPSILPHEQTVFIDWEELTVAMLLNPQTPANRSINLWQRVCDEALSGVTQGAHL